MKGFDPEFRDLDHYIRVITDRIWEGRRMGDIRRYYAQDCAVETPAVVTVGLQPVIEGTRATLAAFPDRRLLAEDVIFSGDEERGFMSSHRILSPMTHAGPGAFGPPTGKTVYARTIADCVCLNNRIVHEWLVRDQAAIARQIGLREQDLAQRWLDQRGGFKKAGMPPAPPPYTSFIDTTAAARRYAQGLRQVWATAAPGDAARGAGQRLRIELAQTHADPCITALPGGETANGIEALGRFWAGLTGALTLQSLEIEHLVANPRPGRATALAMRWRAQTLHTGAGRYGPPSGRPVELLGISHAELQEGKVVREWLLIDDVAVWMQVLLPRSA